MKELPNSPPLSCSKEAIGLLNLTVAELSDLIARIKHVYWNLRGASFIALRRFLAEFAVRLLNHIDAAAQHAVVLGGAIHGSVPGNSIDLPLKATAPPSVNLVAEGLQELAKVTAIYSEHGHAAVQRLTDAGEVGTALVLSVIARDLDQQFWLLEAHLDQQ